MLVKLTDKGGFPVGARNQMKKRLQELAGQKVVVEIKPYTNSRSLAQNRLFHKWVTEIAEQIDAPKDATKEWLKRRYLGEQVHDICGRQVITTESTRKLSVGKFADFLTQIEVWCGQAGVEITHPIDYRLAIYGEAS